MLRLEGLVLEQGDFRLCADWQIGPGARVALIGPSGAGKSTLLAAIAGFLAPRAGRILWQGQDLGPLPPGARPLSILFQDQNLFPHLTLAQNLGLGLRADLKLSPDQRVEVDAALERVGLGGFGPRKPPALSGGQAGRAALARVLLRARPLLLLDEPFAALGPALKDEMLALLAEVASATGAAVLMVTHAPEDALRFADSVSLVAGGEAAAPVPVERIFADPPEALRDYMGRAPGTATGAVTGKGGRIGGA
ncbi:thiamine ABC transporter ATP-binding protein [Pseudogemmobacter sonorensis]|uniref:thiamine ABC transporter ATP-binding protein n=1 Tax=Pseudogemmobacter sonorensis TaxID=2989681 RepID=UPI0036CF6532